MNINIDEQNDQMIKFVSRVFHESLAIIINKASYKENIFRHTYLTTKNL